MRCDDEVLQLKEFHLLLIERFVLPDIECRTFDYPVLECCVEIVLYDDTSACDIDQHRIRLHPLELIEIDHASCLREKWRVDGHDVRMLDDILECRQLHPYLVSYLLRKIWIVTEEIHVEMLETPCDLASDTAYPDDT